MDNSEDFTWVSGHWRRTSPKTPGTFSITVLVRPIRTSASKTFPVVCKYCDGKGRDIGVIDIQEHDCPACKGKGWQALSGSLDDYKPCGHCQGSGKEPGLPENPLIRVNSPDHICHGSGLVSVR